MEEENGVFIMNSGDSGLMAKIEELNRQYQDTLDAYNQETNEDARRMQQAELEKLQAQIDAEKLQEVAEEAAASNEALTLVVGGQAYDFREIISNEVEYQAAKVIISQWQYEQDQKRIREVEAAHERFRQEIKQMQQQMDAMQADHALDRADLEAKRKAATDELAEYKRREEAQAQVAVPVSTNLNSNIAAMMADLRASRPAIYNLQQGDIKGSFFTATKLETGEQIEIPHLELRKWREASEEEVQRFREEQAQREAEEALDQSVEETTEVATVEAPQLPSQFQSEDDTEGTGRELDGHAAETEVAEETEAPVTRAEFDALRHEVTMLAVELKARSILPIDWEAA